MEKGYVEVLRARLTDDQLERLMRLENPALHEFIADAVELCGPASVFVCTDRPDDIACVRRHAVETGEETPLSKWLLRMNAFLSRRPSWRGGLKEKAPRRFSTPR